MLIILGKIRISHVLLLQPPLLSCIKCRTAIGATVSDATPVTLVGILLVAVLCSRVIHWLRGV